MKKILLLATVLLIAVAGCSLPFDSSQTDTADQKPAVTEQDPPPGWTLSVRLFEPNPEPGERVQIEYAGNGHFSGTVYGIRILFLDENKSIIKEVPVENLTTERYYNTVNATVPEPPFYVTAKLEGWDTLGSKFSAITGHLIRSGEVNPLYEVTDESEFIYNGSSG